MGLLDIFKKKTIEEKCAVYAEKGMVGKLCALADEGNPKENRLAAIEALRTIKHATSVNYLVNTGLRDSDIEIRTAVAKALLMNGTKDKTDILLNYSDQEREEGNTELAEILKRAAIDARDRTARVD